MSNSAAPTDPAIEEILKFWFEEIPHEAWFRPPPELDLDSIITNRFLSYVEKAVNTNEFDHWTSTPSGTLALILCLDQFTRNIYRPGAHHQPGLSWSGDAKALQVASEALAKDFDREIEAQYKNSKGWGGGKPYRMFFYMPFMHAEDLVAQIACVALFENLSQEAASEPAEKKVENVEGGQTFVEAMKMSLPFAKKHRNCVAALGRFPKRNEPLGREHTEADKAWLEKYPEGF